MISSYNLSAEELINDALRLEFSEKDVRNIFTEKLIEKAIWKPLVHSSQVTTKFLWAFFGCLGIILQVACGSLESLVVSYLKELSQCTRPILRTTDLSPYCLSLVRSLNAS
jgi:hypothetical protein